MYSAIKSLPNVKLTPPAVLFYGLYCGALPFILIPAYLFFARNFVSELVYANLTYGSIMLTYLGAVRWGFALPETKEKTLEPNFWNMGVAVTPSCIGWFALLIPETAGYITLIGAFSVTLMQDIYSNAYPPWYKSFRIILVYIALFSLMLTYLISKHLCGVKMP